VRYELCQLSLSASLEKPNNARLVDQLLSLKLDVFLTLSRRQDLLRPAQIHVWAKGGSPEVILHGEAVDIVHELVRHDTITAD
jgi:hypothetical protein